MHLNMHTQSPSMETIPKRQALSSWETAHSPPTSMVGLSHQVEEYLRARVCLTFGQGCFGQLPSLPRPQQLGPSEPSPDSWTSSPCPRPPTVPSCLHGHKHHNPLRYSCCLVCSLCYMLGPKAALIPTQPQPSSKPHFTRTRSPLGM